MQGAGCDGVFSGAAADQEAKPDAPAEDEPQAIPINHAKAYALRGW